MIQPTNALVKGIDRYKRILGTCYANKININAKMVRNGYAVAYQKYSKRYVNAEIEAKKDNLGLWNGKFRRYKIARYFT